MFRERIQESGVAGVDRRELRSQELQELQNGERANFVAGKHRRELRSQEFG
jgi:hypothetical protein